MTAAAYPRPDESGRRNHGSHPEENACQGAKDENREVAKNSGGEELRFRHHAFCIKYQDVPGEKAREALSRKDADPLIQGLQVQQHLAGSLSRPTGLQLQARARGVDDVPCRLVLRQGTGRSFWNFPRAHVVVGAGSLVSHFLQPLPQRHCLFKWPRRP